MRSWLLSNTFYGTWLPGDARGSVTSVHDQRDDDSPSEFRLEHDIPGTPWEEEMPGLREAAVAQMKGCGTWFAIFLPRITRITRIK